MRKQTKPSKRRKKEMSLLKRADKRETGRHQKIYTDLIYLGSPYFSPCLHARGSLSLFMLGLLGLA
jgi:hypothetical protein